MITVMSYRCAITAGRRDIRKQERSSAESPMPWRNFHVLPYILDADSFLFHISYALVIRAASGDSCYFVGRNRKFAAEGIAGAVMAITGRREGMHGRINGLSLLQEVVMKLAPGILAARLR